MMVLVTERVELFTALVWMETQFCKLVESCKTIVPPIERLDTVIWNALLLMVKLAKIGAGKGRISNPLDLALSLPGMFTY